MFKDIWQNITQRKEQFLEPGPEFSCQHLAAPQPRTSRASSAGLARLSNGMLYDSSYIKAAAIAQEIGFPPLVVQALNQRAFTVVPEILAEEIND